MIKKNSNDFKEAAKLVRPSKWVIHHCSMCNYPCGYVFDKDFDRTAYDSGCYCVTYDNVNECSWDMLASHYNMQNDEDVIKKMNEFWGFLQ